MVSVRTPREHGFPGPGKQRGFKGRRAVPAAQLSRVSPSCLRYVEDAGAIVDDRVREAGRNVFGRHPEVIAIGVERGRRVVAPATGAVRRR